MESLTVDVAAWSELERPLSGGSKEGPGLVGRRGVEFSISEPRRPPVLDLQAF